MLLVIANEKVMQLALFYAEVYVEVNVNAKPALLIAFFSIKRDVLEIN